MNGYVQNDLDGLRSRKWTVSVSFLFYQLNIQYRQRYELLLNIFSTQKFLWSLWWQYIYTFHFIQHRFWGIKEESKIEWEISPKVKMRSLGLQWSRNLSNHISILMLLQHIYSLFSMFISIWPIYFFSQPPCCSTCFTLSFDIFYIPRGGGWSLELVNKLNNLKVLRFRT